MLPTPFNVQLLNASITISPEVSHVVLVSVQLVNPDGGYVQSMAGVIAYLSDNPTGQTVTATAPDGGVAINTIGGCTPLIAGKAFLLTFTPQGALDLNIQNSAAATWYLVIVLPNGSLIVSGPIAF